MSVGYAYATKGSTTDVDLRIESCDVDYLGTTDPTMQIKMDIRNEAGDKVDTLLGETVSLTAFLDNTQIQLKEVGAGSWSTQLDFTVVNYSTTFYGFDCTDIQFDVDGGDEDKMVRIMGMWTGTSAGYPWKRGKLVPKVRVPPSADCSSCAANCGGAATITMVTSNMVGCVPDGTYTLNTTGACSWSGYGGLSVGCLPGTYIWRVYVDQGGPNETHSHPALFCSGDHPTGSGSWVPGKCGGDYTIS